MTGHSDCIQTHEWVSLGYSIFFSFFFLLAEPLNFSEVPGILQLID